MHSDRLPPVPADVGTYDYGAGTAGGTVSVPAGAVVLQIAGYANGGDGTVTIAGGDDITVRDGIHFNEVPPLGTLTKAAGFDVVFSATMDYHVSWVEPAGS